MIRRTKCGWTAMTMLGLLAGAATADDGAPVGNSSGPTPPANCGPAPGQYGGAEAGTSFQMSGDVGVYRLGSYLNNILAYNPAAGYRPPETVHVERDAVMYHRYWPAKWYGQPGWHLAPTFPMVYMPTDTTQLGVYYARVPQWLPNPGMYPRPPRPDEWNRRVVNADIAGAGCGGGMAVGYGAPMAPSGPTPVDGPAGLKPDTIGTPKPMAPAPQGPATSPPAPRPQADRSLPPAPLAASGQPTGSSN